MPCRDHWDEQESSDRAIQDLQKRNDELAQMLCKLCSHVEYIREYPREIPKIDPFHTIKGLGKWWADHQIADRKHREREDERKRKQRIKQQALAKLTNEERLLLGLSAK